MNQSTLNSHKWQVGLLLVGPTYQEPHSVVRLINLRMTLAHELKVDVGGLCLPPVEVQMLGRVHVHPAAWPIILHEYRMEHARYQVWIQDFGEPPLRLHVDASDDLDAAHRAGAAALEALTSAGDIPGFYEVIDTGRS